MHYQRHAVVEPDLLVIPDDQGDVLTDLHLRGAPALAIEVLSPGSPLLPDLAIDVRALFAPPPRVGPSRPTPAEQ